MLPIHSETSPTIPHQFLPDATCLTVPLLTAATGVAGPNLFISVRHSIPDLFSATCRSYPMRQTVHNLTTPARPTNPGRAIPHHGDEPRQPIPLLPRATHLTPPHRCDLPVTCLCLPCHVSATYLTSPFHHRPL